MLCTSGHFQGGTREKVRGADIRISETLKGLQNARGWSCYPMDVAINDHTSICCPTYYYTASLQVTVGSEFDSVLLSEFLLKLLKWLYCDMK